jgi:hypothetical protein
MRLKPIQLRCRAAVRWPADASLGPGQHANLWGLFRLLTDRPGRVPLGRFWAHKMRVSWCRSWYDE